MRSAMALTRKDLSKVTSCAMSLGVVKPRLLRQAALVRSAYEALLLNPLMRVTMQRFSHCCNLIEKYVPTGKMTDAVHA